MKQSLDRESFKHRLDSMIASLRAEIVSGNRKPGDYLPSELSLAGQFGLSNKSVRAALAVLVNEGLVEKIPRVGNKITNPRAAANPQPVTVRLGAQNVVERDIELSSLLRAFEHLHPNIKVELIPLPSLRYYKTAKQYMTSGMLDAFTMSYRDYIDFVEHDGLASLEPFEPDTHAYPFLNKAYAHEELLYVKPVAFSPIVLLYNKNHFKQSGLSEPDSSWTWEDLFRCAEQLELPKERLGFYFHLFSYNRWPIFLMQSGVRFERRPGGGLSFDRDKFIAGIRTCRELLQKRNVLPGYLSENDSDAEVLFLNEKVSMIMTTYFSLNKLKAASFPMDIAPLPYSEQPITMLLTLGIGVNAGSRVKPEAKMLAEFIAGRDGQQMIRSSSLTLPARRTSAEWTEVSRDKEPYRFHMYREIIPTFHLYTDLQLSLMELGELNVILKLYWSHMEDERSICERVANIGSAYFLQ
ncbi:extracellular solute-binding protein [Paenibacillus allorhizosphaerae]|uniref:HTH gntR-type domain-containing protein n=1 Tax=Paenibacillus allorhizosphaerae TaxID=2849866 RepID=A0ABM8VBA2_9BACL|nr:extracellular solute-binding protein [Paenibacillus allorhizosphaerae]CAG7618915.1 hypothetical protein PAECIP111802_00565 [Paenibacillus allorhizosphaerae]